MLNREYAIVTGNAEIISGYPTMEDASFALHNHPTHSTDTDAFLVEMCPLHHHEIKDFCSICNGEP